jgi:diaminohydroxyphosphoribosylaminopyrimidine deaminase/5-amino-6-(5-phosphoribosylamino)uracil reductase
MPEQTTAPTAIGESAADQAWALVLAAAEEADRLEPAGRPATFAPADDGCLRRVASGDPNGVLAWDPGSRWAVRLPSTDPRHGLIDLYLPVCGATVAHPITVGHLGQSLDGFIATHAGESQYVTGPENILHLHRMRALSDAIVVGAGTVAADDPSLTTRHVTGPSPLRVVLDPTRRLADHYRVFSDGSSPTLYVCGQALARPGERQFGGADIVFVGDGPAGFDAGELLGLLRARGCRRIFVEGGGVTVSAFLQANLLDRLQVATAPLIIGDGRPAIRLTPPTALSDCSRPRYRVFRMGGDVLFDCELRPGGPDTTPQPDPQVARVI